MNSTENQVSFTKVKTKGTVVNKTGKFRKTKEGPGKILDNSMCLSLTSEQATFVMNKCVELGIKKSDYIRSLLTEKMLHS